MNTVTQAADTDTDRPPHPSEHMTPGQFARWCELLEAEAVRRGLPPEPWPMP